MVLEKVGTLLTLRDFPKPKLGKGQLLVRVNVCAVCRTDLHIVDGELPDPKLPLILGHQIVGRVEQVGKDANQQFEVGDRVGIPWLGWTDGDCAYCRSNHENLCGRAKFTGYTIDGYKTMMVDKDCYVSTYTWKGDATYKGQPYPPGPWYCSTVWAKRGKDWMGVYHQETLATPGSATSATESH